MFVCGVSVNVYNIFRYDSTLTQQTTRVRRLANLFWWSKGCNIYYSVVETRMVSPLVYIYARPLKYINIYVGILRYPLTAIWHIQACCEFISNIMSYIYIYIAIQVHNLLDFLHTTLVYIIILYYVRRRYILQPYPSGL